MELSGKRGFTRCWGNLSGEGDDRSSASNCGSVKSSKICRDFKIARYIQIHIRNHSAKYSVTFSTLVVVRRVSGAAVEVVAARRNRPHESSWDFLACLSAIMDHE